MDSTNQTRHAQRDGYAHHQAHVSGSPQRSNTTGSFKDSNDFYSFPMLSRSVPSMAPSSRTRSSPQNTAAAAAAASLSYLLSNPQSGDAKWQEHQQRLLDAMLPPKGFDSVTIQLPSNSMYLNPVRSTTPARNTTRRLPMVAASASIDTSPASPTDDTPSIRAGQAMPTVGPTRVTTSVNADGDINFEAQALSRMSSRRRRQLNASHGTFNRSEDQMAKAAAAAALAAGNAAGTTGAIASAAAAAAALCQEEQECSRREARSAFTLLCVDDDVISCKIISKICEKWGQPYETVTSGDRAVELYKQFPEKYRCILMDINMPIRDGLETTRMIREFEESTWTEGGNGSAKDSRKDSGISLELDPPSTESLNCGPIRRAVIIGMATRTAPALSMDEIKEIGFDVVVEKPLHLRLLSELLFSGPETNAVAVYGGVDPESLRQAGYPLRMKPLGGPRRPPLDSVFGPSFG